MKFLLLSSLVFEPYNADSFVVLIPLFLFLCISMVSFHATDQHLGRASENRKAVASHRTLPAEILDCKYSLKVTPFRETERLSLPYFEGSDIPAPQEKNSLHLDFRSFHPCNTNPYNSMGKAVDILSQLEGGFAEQGDRFWHL